MTNKDVSGSILVIDDDPEIRSGLRDLLATEGYGVVAAASAAAALEVLAKRDVELILLDLGLPDMDGLELLPRVRQLDEHAVVIVLTGRGDIETVVEAMKRGAEHFLVKPMEWDTLKAAVTRGLGHYRMLRRELTADAELRRRGLPAPVGSSPLMRRVRELTERVAATDASVVLLGESGTGKGLLAQLIHHLSRRQHGPLMDLNCAALSPRLLESELFGHERGAFTDARDRKLGLLEVAHGGTLFLDEITELDPAVQSKLLKVVEDRRFRRLGGVRDISVDLRIIVATHRDLRSEVEAGRFRQDLYYRLNVFQIDVPPLRERREDILEIAMHFVGELNPTLGRSINAIDERAAQLLLEYSWPGNVRELRNVIERAMILASGDTVRVEHLSPDLQRGAAGHEGELLASLADVEGTHIRKVLAMTGGNVRRTAQILGIARSTLYAKLQEHNILVPR